MTQPADLTLLMLRLVQGPPKPPVREWFFFPGFVDATASSARALLEAVPKPVLVTPLLDPGCVGLWSTRDMDGDARARTEHQLTNQQQFFDAKMASLFPDGVDSVRLAEGDADLRLDVATFRAWAREYYVVVGSGLDRSEEPRVARLFLRRPGGGQRPIGLDGSRAAT